MNKVIVFILMNSLSISLFCSQSSIIFSLVQYPNSELLSATSKEEKNETKSAQLSQPNFVVAQPKITQPTPGQGVPGVQVRYAGYTTASNNLGLIQLPRKQISNEINFLITKKETPIFQIGPSLVAGWQNGDAANSAFYTVSLHQDGTSDIYYFTTTKSSLAAYNKAQLQKDAKANESTQQKESEQKNDENIIPLNTIIIFADPASVEIPEGDSYTKYTTHLILPDVYIKSMPSAEINLTSVNTRPYFESIDTSVVRSGASIAKQMKNQ